MVLARRFVALQDAGLRICGEPDESGRLRLNRMRVRRDGFEIRSRARATPAVYRCNRFIGNGLSKSSGTASASNDRGPILTALRREFARRSGTLVNGAEVSAGRTPTTGVFDVEARRSRTHSEAVRTSQGRDH